MWNIVIVDDELIIAEGLAKMIRHIGEEYRVTNIFSDAQKAWAYLRENYRQTDLLITDIRMPQMSGLELIGKLHRLKPSLVCAVLTGYSNFQYAKTAIDLGVVSYLLKPVDTQELKALLERLVITDKHADAQTGIVVSGLSRETLYMKNAVENSYRTFDMEAIVGQLQLSRDYLFRLYKRETGKNLMEYLLEIRIQKAKELLMQPGKYKVYEVSELVGYSDYAYFSKIFKKETGITPKKFQKFAKQ